MAFGTRNDLRRRQDTGTKKRLNVVRAKRHRDEENENARSENRRAPYKGERRYADDQYWRSGYRNWVY
jgi:hypothetical protein